MDIIHHIDSLLTDGHLSKADANDYRGVSKSLALYLGRGRDTDILWLTQPAWIDRYCDYLIDQYRSNKRRNTHPTPHECRATALRYLKQLRKIVNRAIAAGQFPDIDIFASTSVAADLSRRKAPTVRSTCDQLRSLVFTRDAALTAIAEPYLISIYLCGATPSQLAQIDERHFDPDTRTVTLPHLRVTAIYTESIYRRIHAYVTAHQGHVYDIASIRFALASAGYDLLSSGDPFTDWLSIAVEAGTLPDPRHTSALRLSGKFTPRAPDTDGICATVRLLCHSYDRHRRSWYVLRTTSESGSTVAQRLLEGNRPYPDILRQRSHDIYVPHIPPADSSRRCRPRAADSSAVLRNVVFFCAEASDAEVIDLALSGSAYVMSRRTSHGREYETVPYREIYTLQLVLRSISSVQAQQALLSEDLRDTLVAKVYQIGDIVAVSVPGFEEYTARVTAVRHDSTYDLKVNSGLFKIGLKNIPQGLIRPL